MSDPAQTIDQNILPVQALFNVDNTFNTFIGQGQPFYATPNPDQSGLHITNSTIDSSVIGGTTPAAAHFTTATVENAPVSGTDVVNKNYLEYFAAGISWKQPVLCGTTTNITLSGLQSCDGVTVASGDRVLVKSQSAPAQNGIYLASASAWTRAPDADTWNELISALVFVESGSTLAGSAWYCTIQPGGTIGTTAITWSNFSVAATYTAGTGLTLTDYVFSITNTGVTAGAYGSASKTLTATVNAQGQLTVLAATDIAIANTQVSGLGTMSTQNASSVAITGGTLNAVTIGGTTAGAVTGTTITANTQFTGPGTGLTGTASGLSIGGSAGTATTATNLSGGAGGSIPYQTASGITAMLATGTGVLVGGATPSYTTTPTLTGTNFSGIPNSALNNSSITLGSTSVSLGATATTVTDLTLANPTVSNYEDWTASAAPTYVSGRTWYDSSFSCLSYYNNTTNNIVRVGQQLQQQVRNATGSTITKGQVVYISGSTGQIGNIILAQANAYSTSQVIGVATQDIANNTDGYVITQGILDDINTNGFTAGAPIYLSASTAGALTQTEPSAPNYAVHMGVCLYANNVHGKIWINPINKSIDSGYIIGQVAIAQGGTNSTATPTAGAVPYGTGTAYAFTAAGTSGQVLTSNGAGAPTWATPAAYATVTDDTTTNATRYPLFASVTTGNLTTEYVSSTKLKFNPSTGALTANQLIIAP